MSLPSQHKDPVRQEARFLLEDSLYSFKAHFNSADTWRWRHGALGIPTVALGAIVTGVAAGGLPAILLGSISAVEMVLVAVLTWWKPAARAEASSNAGHDLQAFHEDLRQWMKLDLPHHAPETATRELKEWTKKKQSFNKRAPPFTRGAYELAKKGIEAGEAEHNLAETEAI